MTSSLHSTRLITLLCLIDLYALMTSASDCVFPAFMTRMSHWYSHVTNENRHVGAFWNFQNHSVAQLTDLGSRTSTNYSCHVVIDHETVLTSITTDGATGTKEYQCLRFIQRSDFVVQLARSTVFNTGSRDQCLEKDRFVLEDSVLVQPVITGAASSDQGSCGLAGGYWLSVVDSASVHTCRDVFLRPIIEADCASPGQGVLIDFRQLRCAVPTISGIETLHQMVCLGSWTQSGFIYIVLSDNKAWPKLWMLKIPEGASEPITARFLTSLSTSPAHNTTAYDFILTPASFPTLCENEATGCDVTTHCADDSAEVHCQKECSACVVATGGSSCQFSDSELGQWFQVSRRRAADNDASKVTTVTVTNKTLQFGTQPAWRCIELLTQHRYPPADTDGRTRRPVAMLFADVGCRPRMACVEVIRQSDVVIQYRFGRKLTWPEPADDVCSDDMFADEDLPDSQYKVLVHADRYISSPVACEIDAWYHLNGSNSTGQHLEGYVDACGPDVTTFRYVTVASSPASSGDKQVTLQETHRCLATFPGHSAIPGAEFTYIITAVAGSYPAAPTRFFCWLLVKSPLQKNLRLHLSYAADCRHSATGIRLSLDESSANYIANFDLMSSDTDDGWIRNCSSRHLVPVVTPGPRRPSTPRLKTPGPDSITLSTTSSASYASLSISIFAAAAVAAAGVASTVNLLLYTAR